MKALTKNPETTMKQKFKLFTTSDGNQVVFERLSNDDDNEAISTVAYNVDGTRMATTAGYEDDDKKADMEFEKINQERAQKWYDAITSMLNN